MCSRYVLYALDRRKKIKETHPGITFSEVTKILGQEWSTMAQEIKDVSHCRDIVFINISLAIKNVMHIGEGVLT